MVVKILQINSHFYFPLEGFFIENHGQVGIRIVTIVVTKILQKIKPIFISI